VYYTIASEQYASTGYPETLSIYLSTLFTLLFTITHFPLHTPIQAVKLTVGETCPKGTSLKMEGTLWKVVYHAIKGMLWNNKEA
jgi:hypothetical protein